MANKFWSLELGSLIRKPRPVAIQPIYNHFEKSIELEKKILCFSRLQLHKELQIFDVPIQLQGQQHMMHTIKCGDKGSNKDTLVLIHGYSGSLTLFYPILKDLSKRFQVYCVDLLGLGLSSRADFPCQSTEETLDYFVDSLEEWRKAIDLDRFFIGGHSFGGYISAFYALKHQKMLDGLFLFSPTGITPREIDENYRREWGPTMTWGQRQFWSMYFEGYSRYIWKDRITPSELVRQNPTLAKYVIRTYMSSLYGVKRFEANLVSDYIFEMLSIPGGSEKSIHYILRPPCMDAYIPLGKYILNDLSLPIHCYYGEQDWVDWTGAQKIAENPKAKNFKFHWIPHSGHQLFIQNPKGLTHSVLKTMEDRKI